MKKILFILLFTTIVLAEPWWNDSFHYRREIFSDTFFDYDIDDYSINFTINTKALIDSGKLREDCRDLVVIEKFDEKLAKLPVFVENCGEESSVYFKAKSLKANSKETFFLYYGNPEFESQNLSKEEILNYYDNFLDGVVDNDLWKIYEEEGNDWTYVSEENGKLSIVSNAQGSYSGGRIDMHSLEFFKPIERIRTKYEIFCSATGPVYSLGALIASSSSITVFDLIGDNISERIDTANCTLGGSISRSFVIDFIYNKSSEVVDIYIDNTFNKSINVSGWGIPQIKAYAESGAWGSQASARFVLEAVNYTEDKWEISFDDEIIQTFFEMDSNVKYQDVLGEIWAYYNFWDFSPILDADCRISIWDSEIQIDNKQMTFSVENQRYELEYTPTKNQLYYYNISCSKNELLSYNRQGTFTTTSISPSSPETQEVSLPPALPLEEPGQNSGSASYNTENSNVLQEAEEVIKESKTALSIEIVKPEQDQELSQKYLQVEIRVEGNNPNCMIKIDDGSYDNMFTNGEKAIYNFLELEEGIHDLSIKCSDDDELKTETLSFSVLPEELESEEEEEEKEEAVMTAAATSDGGFFYGLIVIAAVACFFAYKYRKQIKQEITNHISRLRGQKHKENPKPSLESYHSPSQSKLDSEYI